MKLIFPLTLAGALVACGAVSEPTNMTAALDDQTAIPAVANISAPATSQPTPSPSPTPSAPTANKDWLVGAWVTDRAYCSSSSGVTFKGDGTYWAEGERGLWQLDGSTLTYTALATEEGATLENSNPGEGLVANPKPDPVRVVTHSASVMKNRRGNGPVITLYKCPKY